MGADILGAHARLSAIDPVNPHGTLLQDILESLLKGAGADRGIAVDPSRPDGAACRGISPGPEAFAALVEFLRDPERPRGGAPLPPVVVAGLFEGQELPADPRAIPLTAGEEALAVVVLPAPPVDPVGFASVTAQAASILFSQRMSERVRSADFELKYRVWELESLYDVGLSIARTLDTESLADDILLKSVSLLNARKGTLIVQDISGDGRVLVKTFGEKLLDEKDAAELPDRVIVANRPSERIGPLAHAPAEKLLAVPIKIEGRRLGLLVVADKENRAGGVDDFDRENDGRILSLFGNQAAIALENARLHREALEKERMEREIELAASIQKAILPDALPELPGLLLAGGNRPTRQVGGDYYDVFPLPDGRVAFCVADVSGKGVPAALLVSTLHACLHILVGSGASDLPGLVARINRHLVGFSSTRKFVTLFFAVYEPRTGELKYVNAGHNPGLWLSGEALSLLPSSGLPIGMLPDVKHHERSIVLGPGDLVVLYSDGITEAMDASEIEFGMERLTALVREAGLTPPASLSDRIFAAVADYTRGVAQYDDQTVLVARAV